MPKRNLLVANHNRWGEISPHTHTKTTRPDQKHPTDIPPATTQTQQNRLGRLEIQPTQPETTQLEIKRHHPARNPHQHVQPTRRGEP